MLGLSFEVLLFPKELNQQVVWQSESSSLLVRLTVLCASIRIASDTLSDCYPIFPSRNKLSVTLKHLSSSTINDCSSFIFT